ncbi:hypothetical protein FALBO_5959 [Fusarium albosuccineum]|uniref:Uncharacterized protein n=1 Tax=Fusarium albosuccineum TaxID=1237068 RepID=A0A8H4PF24_9HYPO|nr:hypothetical protein FALBO_5959 [Fusarium albosuccineum]
MRISKTAKAVFLMVNHVLAAHLPPGDVSGRLWGRNSGSAVSSSSSSPSSLFARQQPASCSRCRNRCPRGKIFDPDDCTNCVRCRASTKPDPERKRCIADPDSKRKQFPKKRENMRKDYFDKEKRFKKQIEPKKKEWNDKRDDNKRKMARRVGRCLPLVAMGMGAEAAAHYGDDFFDEDYLESMDLVGFWPEGLSIEPWESETSDDVYESDEYIDKWVKAGQDSPEGFEKRSISRHTRSVSIRANNPAVVHKVDTPSPAREARSDPSATTALVVHPEHGGSIEKRAFWIPIFIAIAKTAAAIGAGIARGAAKGLKGLTKNSIRVAKGRGSKKSRQEQHQGAEKISKAWRFRTCLRKQSP